MTETVVKGYLDVKISSRSRRSFTPWRAWRRQWCEIRRLDDINVGLELKLKSSEDGNILNCVQVPRSATLCRTDSRTKQYAFGVFNLRKTKKAVLFLAGDSETDSQDWMISIRRLLSIADYIPVGGSNFRISLVDTKHSRAAGLVGLYGVLHANAQEIFINDPCSSLPKVSWKWYHFHQFHLQAACELSDNEKIVVMHTSREFPAGPGQLLLYCKEGPQLLHYLITKGQNVLSSSSIMSSKRFSRSEGDICGSRSNVPDSPLCFRSQTGSDDSGVPNTNFSSDNEYNKSKTETNLVNLGMSEITKTPGGSETEDSCPDLQNSLSEDETRPPNNIPRNESGISLASGIYEEIPDDRPSKQNNNDTDNLRFQSHIYENPFELMFDKKLSKYLTAPPLPPRTFTSFTLQRRKAPLVTPPASPCKQRCNTLPAKDLSKISQMFNSMSVQQQQQQNTIESEYVVMKNGGNFDKTRKIMTENFYVPMTSPVIQLKNKIIEGVYMSMSGGAKKAA